MSSRGGADNRRTRQVVTTSRPAGDDSEKKLIFSFSRILNVSIVLLFVCVIALQVTCTVVIWDKQEEMIEKFNCTDEKCCPLFIQLHNGIIETFGNNVYCYFVSCGSSLSALCAAVMIVVLVVRIVMYRRSTACSIVDGLEVTMAALVTCAVSMVVSLGKSETCNSLKYYYKRTSCTDIYLCYTRDFINYRTIEWYSDLLIVEVSSWTAVGVMAIIAIISWSRVFSWVITKCCENQQVTRYQEHHQYRQLQNK